MPDPRPLAGGAALLRRPWPVRPAGAHRTPPAPPTEDEVLRSEYLARALGRTPLQGCRLLSRARTSVGRATPQGPQPRGTRHSGTPAHRGRHAHPGRGRASAPGREEARAKGFVAMVARAEGDSAGSGSHLALIRHALRPGAHLALPQAEHGVDYPSGSSPRVSRPVELAGGGCLRAAKVSARERSGPASAVGAPLR
jgi:hypothetical protein